ncbi:MAG: phosphoribosylglycinamide formyltransferase [Flavobacteriaceae bacterium]|nr:phosphoribosylglycinamide formyltransferase [Flavobacteriaceae bacterium]
MKRIVIFASGSGTNAENISRFFKQSSLASVVHILTNNKDAKVLLRAKKLKINSLRFNREQFLSKEKLIKFLKKEADLIVLAGFLWKIPDHIIKIFPNKIINIHPALLPKYGGKGMYGMNVHNAVVNNKEIETGITIHYINEYYDEGAIIFQAKTPISPFDTSEDVAKKIHLLEQKHFPKVIEDVLLSDEYK